MFISIIGTCSNLKPFWAKLHDLWLGQSKVIGICNLVTQWATYTISRYCGFLQMYKSWMNDRFSSYCLVYNLIGGCALQSMEMVELFETHMQLTLETAWSSSTIIHSAWNEISCWVEWALNLVPWNFGIWYFKFLFL